MPVYKQQENTLLPDGPYPFECVAASEKTSQKQNVKIELTLKVNGTSTVYDNLTFTPASTWRIDAFRQATGEVLKGSDEVSFEAEDCIGRKGMCTIITDTFNGRTRNKVDAYLLPNPTTPGGAPGAGASASGTPVKPSEPPKEIKRNEFDEPDDVTF